MAYYQNAPVDAVTLDPRSLGLAAIGHMGYFRSDASVLWQETLDWLRGP